MKDFSQFINKYQSHMYWLLIPLVGLLMIINQVFTENSSAKAKKDPTAMTTYIPKGFVLVPIQISEFQNLDQILGNYGVIDLYTKRSTLRGRRAIPIAKGVKAIRAPGDPREVGLLVPEGSAKDILSSQGPYFVSIHNPQKNGTQVVTPDKKRRREKS